ncbi:MAG TPA: hypothetical protein DIT13_00225 [Verrucomicrobiales bacterium]|nr:hypothetical protein [Verrucomicrobiales bacterium]HRJ08927.1 DUF1588 domain-containing protein [Prosthecobacter sp.]HRK14741.1 DUF1588 domain-containing protein [Prosthecobacter sp.]
MKRSLQSSIAILAVSCALSDAAELPRTQFDEKHRDFFKDYCAGCHNEETQKGKLRLDDIAFGIDTLESAERWQNILNALNSGEMPPEDETQPDKARKTEFLDDLAGTLVIARKVLGDSGGQITMRRLNRREYKNTIRDLLGVELDVRDLPADGGTGSFDTVGASLFMSGDQIEQYHALGRRALDEHFARTAAAKETFKARTEAEVLGNQRMNNNLKRLKDGHEQYAAWMAAVEEAAKLPENVKLAAELRESTKIPSMNPYDGRRVGLLFNNKWEVLKGAPAPQTFGLGDAETARVQELEHIYQFQYFTDYMSLPARDTGAWLGFYFAWREAYVAADAKWPPGRYTLRMRVAANEAAPAERRFIEIGQRTPDPRDVATFTVFGAHQVTGTLENPQIIETEVNVSADSFREFALREKRPNSRAAEMGIFHDHFAKTGTGPIPAVWVDWFEIEGPVQAKTAAVSFALKSQDRAGVREVIERFATRAFRSQKPDAEYLDKLLLLAETRRKAGDSLEDALKEAMSVVLSSPGFLYLNEPVPEQAPRQLSPLELATRLSYFLWSAPPDDELLKADLTKPEVLAAQVDRLIASEKADEFVGGFAHQWLGLDRLDFFQFDFRLHRAFDDSAKAAAREEVHQTLATLLRENLSLRRLLKSDFIVINGLLADYYDLDGITGDAFRKVTLPAGSPRGGLLGMAAILAMGGNGKHTSPVERGAWVLRKLLHDPPPPAPPNVPQLARLEGKPLTARERILAHQEEPQCASCHRKIDPIGFGLENFDAAGKWRTEDHFEKGKVKKTWPIDPAAAFHNGPAFKDYFELRDLITARSDAFARGFTESLIEYALGRPFGFTDEYLAQSIISRAKAKDFVLREFIHALVSSDAFQRK